MAFRYPFFSVVAVLVFLAVNGQARAAESPDSVVSKDESSRAAVMPFHRCSKPPLPVNEHVTPIDVPAGADLRGHPLSGECKLTIIGAAGCTLSDPYGYGESGEKRDKLQTARSRKGNA